MLRSRAFFALALALAAAACASPAREPLPSAEYAAPGAVGPLPATYRNMPACPVCLELTLTLRPDGGYLVRERLGSSEFYDFGRWQALPDGVLLLTGGRDAPRRYAVRPPDKLDAQPGTHGGDLRREARLEELRGPFRMVGLYDGALFRECRTGITWPLADSRAAAALREEHAGRRDGPLLVALDARFRSSPEGEALLVQRTAAILNERGCPG